MTMEITPTTQVRHSLSPGADRGIAMMLELLPGLFLQTFGLGNIYAGNIFRGVFIMLSYWLLCGVNFLLHFVLIGYVTWPLTMVAFAVFSTIMASNAARRRNRIR